MAEIMMPVRAKDHGASSSSRGPRSTEAAGPRTRAREAARASVIGGLVNRLAAALAFAMAACAADEPRRDEFRVVIDTVDGVEYVRAFGAPRVFEIEPGVRIGSGGGAGDPGPDEFGMVRSIVADAGGAIYVADVQANEIRVFGADGAHLRTIGRSGDGPGEFNALYALAWIGDTLAAFDPRNGRIGFLSPAGDWLGSTLYLPLTADPMTVRFHAASVDEAYIIGYLRREDGSRMIFNRVTGSGIADTLVPPPLTGFGPSPVIVCPHPDGGISFFTTPFAPRHVTTPAPGGVLATAWSADYRVALVTEAGDTVRVIERDYRPYPLMDEEWEAGTADYRRFREEMPGVRCEPPGLSRPDAKPAIRHLFFDAEGRLWVERYADDGFAYDIFDRDGRFLGTVDVPDRDERFPPYARSGWLYQVETDEFGVQQVASYRVVGLDGDG